MGRRQITFEIGKLPDDRWRDYRRLRLEALRSNPLAFRHSYGEERGLPESEWRTRIHRVIFATANGRPVGMIGYGFGDTAKTRHVAELDSFYVRDACRGNGIGDELFRAAVNHIRDDRGADKIKLIVNAEQKAAIRLYRKEGFAVVGRLRREARFGNRFYDKLIMERLF